MLTRGEFDCLADAAFRRIEEALDACDADYEMLSGGVLEIEFDDGSKIVVNRHAAAQEIWVAARSGGYHFRPEDGRWLNTRDGEELMAVLSRCVSEQAGEQVTLE
ncbi:MAG: iron donor protein CyaY [Candidatus Nitricoxidivorans perseverans]|uniref:Iron-sulfur cluster assembly protein CyaY n=1 Tax=Candidatus Nitricoxidivorans perseverans TaxID=2975601 RepID=A0AA49FKJ0_9PROT|nr:MAG: iron donor protein CyaY [Candidatus Nitricoxidivorans perseverans]